MAALQERHGSFRVIFRYHGKQHSFTLGEVSRDEAETKAAQVDYLLMRLKQRLATLPEGMGIVAYMEFDGKPSATNTDSTSALIKATLVNLRDRYIAVNKDSLEASTLATIRIHFDHLLAHFGKAYPVAELSAVALQEYVTDRGKADGRRDRKLSATTIKKEVATFHTAWIWGRTANLVSGAFPSDGLRYPKITEKPRFQTLAEIERKIKTGGLSEAEQADLYDALYLQLHETAELLRYVEMSAEEGFVYPMFCMAAHTGARRSELIRMKMSDVDIASKTVTIHERKRVKGAATTRSVPMSAFLVEAVAKWLANHPGGPWLFCRKATAVHRGKRMEALRRQRRKKKALRKAVAPIWAMPANTGPKPLTKSEASNYFHKALADSKWDVLRGWHALRHSFVSACASRGVDQRLVEAWAGHMTKEMSRRYAHLYPSVQQQALSGVFDAA